MRIRSAFLTSVLAYTLILTNAHAATSHTAMTDASGGGSTVTGDCTSTHNGFAAGLFNMTCKLFKGGIEVDSDIYDADMQSAGNSRNLGDVSKTVSPNCVYCTRNLSRYFDPSTTVVEGQVDGVGCDASDGPGGPN